jgi:hypothetical protein
MTSGAALGQQIVEPSVVGQKQILESWSRGGGKPAPFADGDKHGRLGAALGHNLWPLSLAGCEKFTKTRFGVLHWPGFHYFIRLKLTG